MHMCATYDVLIKPVWSKGCAECTMRHPGVFQFEYTLIKMYFVCLD